MILLLNMDYFCNMRNFLLKIVRTLVEQKTSHKNIINTGKCEKPVKFSSLQTGFTIIELDIIYFQIESFTQYDSHPNPNRCLCKNWKLNFGFNHGNSRE